jgi:hypothetical protein
VEGIEGERIGGGSAKGGGEEEEKVEEEADTVAEWEVAKVKDPKILFFLHANSGGGGGVFQVYCIMQLRLTGRVRVGSWRTFGLED